MQWALVSTIDQTIGLWVLVQTGVDLQGNPMYGYEWQQRDIGPGTIVNLIVYDGVSPYTPPDGTRLEQVPDTAQIGDTGY